MKLKFLKYTLPLFLLVVGGVIFKDASIYALMPHDPISGRVRACYTTIELIIGVKHPTWIRGAEYITAIAMIPLSIFSFVFIGKRIKQRKIN